MAGLGLIRRFFGRTVGEAAAFGIGGALHGPIRPYLYDVTNEANKLHPVRPLDANEAARLEAEGLAPEIDWREQAAFTGVDGTRFEAMVRSVQNAPDLNVLYELWRRHEIDDAGFLFGLKKGFVAQEFRTPLEHLKTIRLTPEEIANAVQQGFVQPGGVLPDDPGGAAPFTPPTSEVPIDPHTEAEASGVDADRLRVLAELSGNPPGPMELLQLWNRGVITEEAVNRGIREGRTKTKWTSALKALKRRILTPHEYAELLIRGWIQPADYHPGTRLSGMDDADADLLAKMIGRPLNIHDVVRGIARGGVYGGPTTDIPTPYLRSLQEGNLRPEWYSIAYHNRYTYPSAFVLRALTSGGDLTQPQTEQILLYEGWEPTLAHTVSVKWAGGTATTPTADPNVKKAQSQLWTATHRSYVVSDASESEARTRLTALGATGVAQDAIIALWNAERSLVRADLSRGDVRKEFAASRITEAEAITRLQQLGYSQAEATAYLHI